MVGLVNLMLKIIPPAILGGISSIILHEGLHWAVERPFSSEVGFAIDGWNPNVQLNAPYQLPLWTIRIAGAAPFITGIAITGVTFIVADPVENPTFWSVYFYVLGITTALPTLRSGGDILAIFAPRKFQEYAADTKNEAPSYQEARDIIRRNSSGQE